MLKHFNIPIFIPELACPFQCVYCNQKKISGQLAIPSFEEVDQVIQKYLKTINSFNSTVEVAFFGGNFTGLPLDIQVKYLNKVIPYIQTNQVKSVRLSTRPDYIHDENLRLLKKYFVKTIELGAQSLDEEVLKICGRGHTVEDVSFSSKKIKEMGFRLGLQMMIGLPGDTLDKSIHTAHEIVSLGAEDVRIYPTLVIKDTLLEKLYLQNKYYPLTVETAVNWCKELYLIFEKAGVNVLRVGLHPSEGLIDGSSLVTGPFHISFRELVLTEIWKEKLNIIEKNGPKNITIYVSPKEINYAIGYNASNKKMLLKYFSGVKFIIAENLKERGFSVSLS